MINLLILLITITVMTGLLCIIIHYLSVDDIRITFHSKSFIVSVMSMLVFNTLILYIYKPGEKYFALCILILYLTITAYVDYRTMHVYRILNILFFVAGIMLLVIFKQETGSQIIGAFIYSGIVLFTAFTGGFGKGDAFMLITLIPYMMFLNLENDFLLIMLIDTVFFSILFILFNIRKINLKRLKLKEKSALTPAIAVSTGILIIACGLI